MNKFLEWAQKSEIALEDRVTISFDAADEREVLDRLEAGVSATFSQVDRIGNRLFVRFLMRDIPGNREHVEDALLPFSRFEFE